MTIGTDGDPEGSNKRMRIRRHMSEKLGMPVFRTAPLNELKMTQCCAEFEKNIMEMGVLDEFKRNKVVDEFFKMARNRLIMGSLRYGQIGDSEKPPYNRFDSILRRTVAYIEKPNMEHMIDIFNEALLQYVEPFPVTQPIYRKPVINCYVVEGSEKFMLTEAKVLLESLYHLMSDYVTLTDARLRKNNLLAIGSCVAARFCLDWKAGNRPVPQDDGPIHTS